MDEKSEMETLQSAQDLEKEVAAFFKHKNYEVAWDTKIEGESGIKHQIDVLAEYDAPLHDTTILVECKFREKSIGKTPVFKLWGVVKDLGADKGIIVSNSGFTTGAFVIAQDLKEIHLWNRTKYWNQIKYRAETTKAFPPATKRKRRDHEISYTFKEEE